MLEQHEYLKGGETMINLKDIRTEKGLTQQELADECDVNRTTITNIENGIINPSVQLAKKLGKILGFDWTLFFSD